MDEQLFRTLLYENEGPALDFKRDQYAFIGSDEQNKSKLLKDILAFANSWRRGDAYILLGIKAFNDGTRDCVGISSEEHLDDADLQQFVNSKTNRKVEFSYKAVLFEGLRFGVITIPKQKRPTYATKDYGIVKAREVYFRRGSSCAIATVDDLYQMGIDDGKKIQSNPTIRLEFANLKQRKPLGGNLLIKTVYHAPHKKKDFPNAKNSDETSRAVGISYTNYDYWRELADYTWARRAFYSIGFAATNMGDELAKSVRLDIECPTLDKLLFREKGDMPTFPEYSKDITFSRFSPFDFSETGEEAKKSPRIDKYEDRWLINIPLGDIQPKSTNWATKPIFIAAPSSGTYPLVVQIYADNISQPQEVKVILDFDVEELPVLTLNDLEQMKSERFLRRAKVYQELGITSDDEE